MSAPLGRRSLLFGLAVLALGGASVRAQDTYPARPITLVVPFAAGGPTDTIARLVAAPMVESDPNDQ